MSDQAPLFSIVIPVYNGEDYVAEAIDSVLEQTLGLDSLEVVLVNDGSVDGTARILEGYGERFPQHVRIIHKNENAGVAEALNAGVERARGRVVGFLGSDDKLSVDALELVGKFFADHWDDCDLAAIPLFMFGARTGPHWNNRNRFSETRVIDVTQDWNFTQVHGGGSFIKAEMFHEHGLRFDPKLFISEDLTLNTQVILRRMKYGVVADAKYFNRRHAVGGSLVSSSHFRPEFYTEIPRRAYQKVLDAGAEMYGQPPLYVQAMVAYDLSWRFRADLSVMPPSLESEYRHLLKSLLLQLDVRAIMAQRAPIEVRLSMLRLRNDGLWDKAERRGLSYFVEGQPVYSLDARPRARHKPARCDFEFFEVSGDTVTLEGHFRLLEVDGWDLYIEAGGRSYPVERLADPRVARRSLASEIPASTLFRCRVVLRHGESLRAMVVLADGIGEAISTPVQPRMNRFTGFSGSPSASYFRRDGRVIYRRTDKFSIQKREVSLLGLVKAEAGFLRRAYKAGGRRRDLLVRLGAIARGALSRRRIWLMADHKTEAGDNAEAMFRHLCDQPRQGVEPWFVLSRDAPQYSELAKLGRVVEPGSRAHIRKYLDAEAVLNSAADEYMLNPLGRRVTFLNDRARHQRVFLQHGVTKDDQSAWLNRWNKGFDVFVTSSPREQRSIVEGGYGYRAEHVVLTGMPRFDRLESRAEKLIVFAPTWRKTLAGRLDTVTGRVGSNPAFAASDYFAFWQRVILDPRLNAGLASHGFRGVFALHPSHAAEVDAFEASPLIQFSPYPHDYRDLFKRGSVLVTDYSSVAFDFAYLRKPVVYVQGDREEFFSGHLYSEGYFSYDDDGFGPVVDSVEALVDELVKRMVSDGRMDPVFKGRVDDFFAFDGGGNSSRVADAIEAAAARA